MYEREVLQRADGAIDVNFEGGNAQNGSNGMPNGLRTRVMDLEDVLGLRLPVEDERDWRRDCE